MVSALNRKLGRDLWRLRGQVLSIAAVVSCGVGSVIAMRSTLDSIQSTRQEYYDRARFPDVFASLERAPESLARRVAAIPGISALETRVVEDVVLSVPGLPELATGHLVSIPDDSAPLLSALQLRRGRYLTVGARDEVLVNEHFATANRIVPGDSMGALINGRWQRVRIVGVALSPEYVHAAVPGGGIFTDSKHLAILWMRRGALAPAFQMDGAFNDIAARLAPGANESAVIASLDALLTPYGGGRAYGRKDQASNSVLSGEIEQLRVFGTAMPLIFLAVAAFLLNVVLARLVATQREEIATLKAFGYSSWVIARHFLGYAMAPIALGAVGGIALGVWVGRGYTRLYAEFFHFPQFTHRVAPAVVLAAIIVSGGAAALGALQAVRAAVSLQPAEGMRPAAPTSFRALWLERFGLVGLMPPAARMILRNLERRPFRTLTSALGVAFAAAILVSGLFAYDSAHYLANLQFGQVEREDISVAFVNPRPPRIAHDLSHVPGVVLVEPFRSVPVRIRVGHRSRLIAITGLPPRSVLRRLVDRDGHAYATPPTGLVLTRALGELLHAGPGDTVQVELLERGGATRRVVVVALIDELLGLGAYMDLAAVNQLAGDGPLVSGANLLIEPGAEREVARELSEVPAVGGTATRRAMMESFDAQLASSLRLTVTVVVSLAAVVAVGVVYNGNRIALSERARDLASLRVLGFTRREVAALLFGEQGVITALGTPLGLALGFALALLIATAFKSEKYRFPVIVGPRTYLLAVLVIVVAFVFASIPMRRRVNELDLVRVLKTRE